MADIDIRRRHAGDRQKAKAAIEKVAQSISRQYGVEHRWKGDELHFDRGGVKGRITVAENEVRVHAELGFMMSALKPVIEREIERQLDEHVA